MAKAGLSPAPKYLRAKDKERIRREGRKECTFSGFFADHLRLLLLVLFVVVLETKKKKDIDILHRSRKDLANFKDIFLRYVLFVIIFCKAINDVISSNTFQRVSKFYF